MDLVKAVQNYILKMVNEVPGMKVLLLDAETVSLQRNIVLAFIVLTKKKRAKKKKNFITEKPNPKPTSYLDSDYFQCNDPI